MTWTATTEETPALLPEGQYPAFPVSIRDIDGPHGPSVRIEFQIADHDHEGQLVSGIARKKLSENTKLGRWVSALLGRPLDVGEQITETHLLRKDCHITVKHKANNDGQQFANVSDVHAITVNE
jgi:hypothetical protein